MTDAVSLIGQYGWSWWASVGRPPACLYSAWSCHSRTASTPSSSAAACPRRGVERERADVGMVLPQVHALHERLLVAALLLERDDVAGGALVHRRGDGLLVAVELVAEQIGYHHEPVAPERLHQLRSTRPAPAVHARSMAGDVAQVAVRCPNLIRFPSPSSTANSRRPQG